MPDHTVRPGPHASPSSRSLLSNHRYGGNPSSRSDEIHDIATNGESETSLDDKGIDDLCERVNSAPAAVDLTKISTEDLFAEIRRRDALAGLHGAIGALYDHLEQQDLISGGFHLLTYLAYRLRREEALVDRNQPARDAGAYWQRKIDQMDKAKQA